MKTRKLLLLAASFMLFAFAAKAQLVIPTDGYGYAIYNNTGERIYYHISGYCWYGNSIYNIERSNPINDSNYEYGYISGDSYHDISNINLVIKDQFNSETIIETTREELEDYGFYNNPVTAPYPGEPGAELHILCTRIGNFWILEITKEYVN
jgi:hypothetical protein